ARRLKLEQKAPALVAADIYRPAAAEQLRQLGQQVGVPVFGAGVGAQHAAPVQKLVQGALREAESARARTVIVDTAGRLQIDGDARGGAALSIHGVTGVPIKYVGVGEKTDALEPFDPGRMAGRILGQGDVVALVEKAAATVDTEAAKRLDQKVRSKQGMDHT